VVVLVLVVLVAAIVVVVVVVGINVEAYIQIGRVGINCVAEFMDMRASMSSL
jgi:hypothetical protein